jgi:hypothetical protein
MPVELDCCECGRHVFRFTRRKPEPPLCLECTVLPGWHLDPQLQDLIEGEAEDLRSTAIVLPRPSGA